MTNHKHKQSTLPDAPLFGIVLAAGRAERYGAVKQLARYGGQTLVARAVGETAAVCAVRTILVTGHSGEAVHGACAPLPGYFVHNAEFADGLAGSIACGILAVRHVAAAVLITLADQPLIDRRHLAALQAAWRSAPEHIAATGYAGGAGVPAIFPRCEFDRLLALRGDQGARQLLAECGRQLNVVACDAALVDIDRPEDLDALPSTRV